MPHKPKVQHFGCQHFDNEQAILGKSFTMQRKETRTIWTKFVVEIAKATCGFPS
jgi:hypothetical protein